MSEAWSSGCAGGEARRRATGWLGLAAAPTFAVMAVLTGLSGGGELAVLCGSAHGGPALNGMGLMYGLMTVFHLAPWLHLAGRRTR